MPVMQERVADRQHEERGVDVDHALLHRDEAGAEEVAQHDDRELDEDQQCGQPHQPPADLLVDPVAAARDRREDAVSFHDVPASSIPPALSPT